MKSLWSSVLDWAWRVLDVLQPQLVPVRVEAPRSEWPGAAPRVSAPRHGEQAVRWSPDGPSRAWKRRSLDRFAHHRRG
jgi:hypothetical protein